MSRAVRWLLVSFRRAIVGLLGLGALASCSSPSEPVVATSLAIIRSAAGAASDRAFTTQPAVALRSASGDRAPTAGVSVVMTVSAGATTVGSATATTVDGVATFGNVGLSGIAGETYTLTFSSGTLTPATQTIAPVAGAAAQLAIVTAAAGAASGAAMTTQPIIEVRDAMGNRRLTDNSAVVTLSASAGVTLVGTTSATAVAGRATFADAGTSALIGTYDLTYASMGLTVATQTLQVGAGAATQLVLATPADEAESGQPFVRQPVVQLRDRAGNPVVGDNSTVVSLTVSAGASLVGPTQATASAGIVRFGTSGVSGTPGQAYTLGFTSGSLTVAQQSIRLVLEDWTAVSAGFSQLCALTSGGSTRCWGGAWGTGRSALGGGFTFASVAVGEQVNCGLQQGGVARCWGAGSPLGDGVSTSSATPVLVAGGLTFAQLTVGSQHACGLTVSGDAWCWGLNEWHLLGDGTVNTSTVPVPVSGGLKFEALDAGRYHTCGIAVGGAAYCWGLNSDGQLGDTTAAPAVPVPVRGGNLFSSISSGGFHTCGITTTGAALCWGANASAQLGIGSFTARSSTPVAVAGGNQFVAITAANLSTCARTAAGAAYCWGHNGNGIVGDGTENNMRTSPTAVLGGIVFSQVVAGGYFACGTVASGALLCWGRNFDAQIDATLEPRPTPTLIPRP